MVSIFHGPGGRDEAVEFAEEHGRLLLEPVGDDGLKVAQARELVELLRMPPIGRKGSLVVGPIDVAQPEAADALLKTIEEIDENIFVLCLWAHDLMDVVPTIESRCQHVWCPDDEDEEEDEDIYEAAMALVESFRAKDIIQTIETLEEKVKKKSKQDVLEKVIRKIPDILAADVRAGKTSTRDLELWGRLRKVLQYKNLSRAEVFSSVLAGGTR